jgi:hypothetical protein
MEKELSVTIHISCYWLLVNSYGVVSLRFLVIPPVTLEVMQSKPLQGFSWLITISLYLADKKKNEF